MLRRTPRPTMAYLSSWVSGHKRQRSTTFIRLSAPPKNRAACPLSEYVFFCFCGTKVTRLCGTVCQHGTRMCSFLLRFFVHSSFLFLCSSLVLPSFFPFRHWSIIEPPPKSKNTPKCSFAPRQTGLTPVFCISCLRHNWTTIYI